MIWLDRFAEMSRLENQHGARRGGRILSKEGRDSEREWKSLHPNYRIVFIICYLFKVHSLLPASDPECTIQLDCKVYKKSKQRCPDAHMINLGHEERYVQAQTDYTTHQGYVWIVVWNEVHDIEIPYWTRPGEGCVDCRAFCEIYNKNELEAVEYYAEHPDVPGAPMHVSVTQHHEIEMM